MSEEEREVYIRKAMDRIIEETTWIGQFPEQCIGRIRTICELVKENKPLPF